MIKANPECPQKTEQIKDQHIKYTNTQKNDTVSRFSPLTAVDIREINLNHI